MSLIAEIFLKLSIPKNVVTEIDTRSCFGKPLGSQGVNESQKLLKFKEKHFYCTF